MKWAYIIPISILLQSCYSSSVMQTAKPLEKGESDFSIGADGYASSGDMFPGLELMYRRGINGKSDFGARYTFGLWGHGRIDYKYNFFRSANERLFLSSGIGFDAYVPDSFGGQNWFVGPYVPLYFSFNHGNPVVPYFSQGFSFGLNDLRGLAPNQVPITSNYQGFEHTMFYNGGFGIRFGQRRVKYFVELSYGVRLENQVREQQNGPEGAEYWTIVHSQDTDLVFQLSTGITIGNKR